MSTQSATKMSRVLVTSQSLITEFGKCCEEYERLHVAVAWCGDPQHAKIFRLLKTFGRNVTVTIGVALSHTHPDAIQWFLRRQMNLRVVRNDILFFHPKVYLFTDGDLYAAIVGSSNLTRGGFQGNAEVNTLLQGSFKDDASEDIRELQTTLKQWHSDEYSFKPTDEWLQSYRKQYWAAVDKAKTVKLATPPVHEESSTSAAWFQIADWATYYRRLREGLRQNGRTAQQYHDVLEAAASELSVPWHVAYFDGLGNRKIMGGMEPYAWLGHVAASPKLRGLLVNGATSKKQTIVDAMNNIAALEYPIEWKTLEIELNRLTSLGHTMKVWGRFLCLVRPDLYCSVASDTLRANLGETLNVSQSAFITAAGYIQLLKLIHSTPWFLSVRPQEPSESAVWQRRVAFMDPIFY